MPLSHRWFVASISLYLISLVSGVAVWLTDCDPFLIIVPLFLGSVASIAMIVFLDFRVAEKD